MINCIPIGGNGCGSSHWALLLFRVPFGIFKHCCNIHDNRYTDQSGKDAADDELYNCAYYDAFHSRRWQRGLKIIIADLMYMAITSRLSNLAYRASGPKHGSRKAAK